MSRERWTGPTGRVEAGLLGNQSASSGRLGRYFDYVMLPTVVYGLAVIFITWPLVTQFTTHFVGGEHSDVVEHVRLVWWTQHALENGLNPFYQSLFAYPDGFFSAVQWAQPLVYWPPALISPVVGPGPAVNLWLMAIMVLNGLTGYWLGRWVLGASAPPRTAQLAALVGGLIFMAFPTVQAHVMMGHIQIISLYALPVFVWSLHQIGTGQGDRRLIMLGAVALWIMALSNYTGAVFQILPVVLFGGGYLVWMRRAQLVEERFRTIRQMLWIFGLAAVLILPFYLPLLVEAADPNRPGYLREVGWILFSTDPLSFISPSPYTSWHEPFVPQFSYHIHNANVREGAAYLGIAAVGLVIVALVRRRRDRGVWLAILIGCMVFSLGPMLKWHEQAVVYRLGLDKSHVLLPWALFQKLPLINITRTPGRFNMTTGLALGVLAALGLYELLRRSRRPTVQTLAAGMIMVFIMAEYQLFFPFPTHTPNQREAFDRLAERDDVRAVFDVPWFETQKRGLYEQLEHHQAMLAGYVSRRTAVDPAKLTVLSEVASGLAWQVDPDTGRFPGRLLAVDDARRVLTDHGVDVVVLHGDDTLSAWQRQWARALGTVLFEDAQIGIVEIPKPVPPSAALVMTHRGQYQWPFSPPDSGWWPETPSSPPSEDGLWLKQQASITLYTPQPILREFSFDFRPLVRSNRVKLLVDGIHYRTWDVNERVTPVSFWVSLEAGFHTLDLVAAGCTPVPVAPSCLLRGVPTVDSPECQLEPEARDLCVSLRVDAFTSRDPGLVFQAQPVQLEHGMVLRGYRIGKQVCDDNTLLVETQWQATQHLPGAYHLFIHLYDEDGAFIAQYDGIPASGNFPTTAWPASLVWSEVVSVALPADLALVGQTVEVYAGWYSYPEVDRLVVHGDGKRAMDGLVYLTSVELPNRCP